jgi:branched-chain amino acid transport system permease protein
MNVPARETAGGKSAARLLLAPFAGLTGGLTATGHALLIAFLAVLVSLPWWGGSYILTIGTIVLYLSLMGQSWNIMLGFAGLLSIGHALFVGIGAYTAGYLFAKHGILPVFGVVPAVALAVLMGMAIGYLGFRFSIGGVYFALLTIAFAEFTRIMVDHMDFLGGTQGLFLPVTDEDRHGADLLSLRGHPVMFYYLILVLCFGTLGLCRRLMSSRLGYYWQAIRDDADAAQALGVDIFRYRMYAVMISAAIAGVGGVFYAFYQNGLFPESTFSIERSIEYTLGPIVGGVGSLFGPIFGAFLLTPLGEFITWSIDFMKENGIIDPSLKLNGLKLFIWGIVVVLIVLFKPRGLWPWVRDKLRLVRPPGGEG